jgi:glycosyltransferase involved in cell wall biosynthesis
MSKVRLFFVIHGLRFLSFFVRLFKKKHFKQGSILYLENFPVENAGYQYRARKWADELENYGYSVMVWTLFENKSEFDEMRKVKPFSRFLIKTLKIRFLQVWKSRKFETVIVRRELLFFNDYGNLFLDKWLLKLHPLAILDFDDDISAAKGQPKKIKNKYALALIENGDKFNDTLRLYKRFIVASNYLKQKVLNENKSLGPNNILVIPTCVDYSKYASKEYDSFSSMRSFGWIGGNHNYPELKRIIPVLNELSVSHSFKLIVIGGEKFESDATFEVEFISWSLESEIDSLSKVDIGLMPLVENKKTQGKGGFKLIQYMGLGIVSVASGVTINTEIIENKKNGFLVFDSSDWKEVLLKVLTAKSTDLNLIGEKARSTIKKNYSFTAHKNSYLNFLMETK